VRIQKISCKPIWSGRALAIPTPLQGASALDLPCECTKKYSTLPLFFYLPAVHQKSLNYGARLAKNKRESKFLFFTQRTTGSGLYSPNTLGIVSRLTSRRMQFAAKNTNNPATI
jgi:hypothetical protein